MLKIVKSIYFWQLFSIFALWRNIQHNKNKLGNSCKLRVAAR